MVALSPNYFNSVKELYLKKELSAREIAEHYKVSLDAVYYFLRRHGIPRRSSSEWNVLNFINKAPSFHFKERLSNKEKILLVAALMLYWGEGYNAEGGETLDFANSNSEMVRIFVRSLRDIFRVNAKRLRCYLYCYSNQNVSQLISYWSRLTGIPKTQFTKPYVRNDFNPAKTGKMPYGLIHIRYSDKKLLLFFKYLIQKFSQELGT